MHKTQSQRSCSYTLVVCETETSICIGHLNDGKCHHDPLRPFPRSAFDPNLFSSTNEMYCMLFIAIIIIVLSLVLATYK